MKNIEHFDISIIINQRGIFEQLDGVNSKGMVVGGSIVPIRSNSWSCKPKFIYYILESHEKPFRVCCSLRKLQQSGIWYSGLD